MVGSQYFRLRFLQIRKYDCLPSLETLFLRLLALAGKTALETERLTILYGAVVLNFLVGGFLCDLGLVLAPCRTSELRPLYRGQETTIHDLSIGAVLIASFFGYGIPIDLWVKLGF